MLRFSKTQILVSSSTTDGLGQGPIRPASAKGRISLAQPGHHGLRVGGDSDVGARRGVGHR
jgi:hypothetical protein